MQTYAKCARMPNMLHVYEVAIVSGLNKCWWESNFNFHVSFFFFFLNNKKYITINITVQNNTLAHNQTFSTQELYLYL